MIDKKHSIVVAGDVTIDWFMYPVKARDEGDNWRLHYALHSDALMVQIYQKKVSCAIFHLIR